MTSSPTVQPVWQRYRRGPGASRRQRRPWEARLQLAPRLSKMALSDCYCWINNRWSSQDALRVVPDAQTAFTHRQPGRGNLLRRRSFTKA